MDSANPRDLWDKVDATWQLSRRAVRSLTSSRAPGFPPRGASAVKQLVSLFPKFPAAIPSLWGLGGHAIDYRPSSKFQMFTILEHAVTTEDYNIIGPLGEVKPSPEDNSPIGTESSVTSSVEFLTESFSSDVDSFFEEEEHAVTTEDYNIIGPRDEGNPSPEDNSPIGTESVTSSLELLTESSSSDVDSFEEEALLSAMPELPGEFNPDSGSAASLSPELSPETPATPVATPPSTPTASTMASQQSPVSEADIAGLTQTLSATATDSSTPLGTSSSDSFGPSTVSVDILKLKEIASDYRQ